MRAVTARGHVRGIEAQGGAVDLREHGDGAHAQDRVRGGDEGERRADDLVAVADVEGHEGQLEGVGAGGGQEDAAPGQHSGQPFLHPLPERAVAGHPPRKRPAGIRRLGVVEPRFAERDQGRRHGGRLSSKGTPVGRGRETRHSGP